MTLTYALSSIVVYLGLVFGIIVAYIAKEELKDGKPYFIFLQNLIVALIIGALLYFYRISTYFIILFTLITFLATYLTDDIRRSYFIYPLLAIPFYLNMNNPPSFILESLLILFYGFPTAALFVQKRKKIHFILLSHISFVVVALLLLLI